MFTFSLSRDQYGLLLAALDEAAASTVLDQSKRIIGLINAIEAQVKTGDPVQLELPLGRDATAAVTPEPFDAVVTGLEGLAAGLPVQPTELQPDAPILKPKRKSKRRADPVQAAHREAEAVAAAIAKDFPATKTDSGLTKQVIVLGQPLPVTEPTLGTIKLYRPGR